MAWEDRRLGKLLKQSNPKLKPILNHLRGGSRSAQRKGAAAAADAIPPPRLFAASEGQQEGDVPLRAVMSVEAVAVRPHMCM